MLILGLLCYLIVMTRTWCRKITRLQNRTWRSFVEDILNNLLNAFAREQITNLRLLLYLYLLGFLSHALLNTSSTWMLSIQPKIPVSISGIISVANIFQLTVTDWELFPKFPKKWTSARRISKFGFREFLPGNFGSIQFCSWNFWTFRLSGSHFGN